MSKPFDATTRYLLEAHPDAWLGLLGLPRRWPVAAIDADLSTITSEADKILRVAAPEPWLLHVELQASHDASLPRRLLRYNVLLDGRHDLPARSVAVLLRREADGPGLTGTLRRRVPGEEVHHEFRYGVIRVWQQPPEVFLEGGLGILPLAPLSDVAPGDLPGMVRRMDDRLAREADPPDADLLWTATYLLMGLRYPEEFTDQLLKGVRGMEESATYQAILRKGEARGRVEGLAEGWAEGEARGKLDEAKRLLLRLGRKRFGTPSAEATAAIEAIGDHQRAEALAERVLDASSWDELLAAPGAG